MIQSHFFVCPHCLGRLTETPDTLACPGCKQTFPLWHGVPNFGAQTDYYYGEFPQAIMRSIIETAAAAGSTKAFESALKDKTDDWRRYFLHYATDETRAAWQFLLHLPEDARALDMGCGWGNLSISLARNFATVYAMDLVPERAVITSIRAREAGFQNVHAVAGGNTARLPFPDASLDAVILNGVLEWVATSFPDIHDPREAQLRVLREIVRVLKPEGQIYIGIENRFGFLYFLGRPDEHSKLKFTTLMPRWLANRYSLAKRKQPYRTFTYGWRGYRKLLHEAGLADTKFYCPFPEYREFSELFSLDYAQDLTRIFHPTSFFRRLCVQICKRVNIFREFSPSYSIVASKASGSNRFIDRLLLNIGVAISDDLSLHITRTAAALLFTPEVVVRLPLTARAERRMQKEVANLKQIGAPQRPLVPTLIVEGKLQGQAYLVTPRFPGVSGMKLLRDSRKLSHALHEAIDFATQLHHETRTEQVCTEEWLQTHFNWLVDSVDALGVNVTELKALCRRDLLGKRVVTVTAHGDFSLQNLLFDPNTAKLTGVVDWDLAEPVGWPFRDVIHLLVALEYERKDATLNEAAIKVMKRLRNPDGNERQLLQSYLSTLNIGPEQVVWAIQAYLLRSIYDKHEFGDKKTTPLLKHLTTELAAARVTTREWLEGSPLSHQGHVNDFSVPSPRLQELARELSGYNRAPVDQVYERLEKELLGLGGYIAEEWHERRPKTARQIEQFYENTDAYLYELLIDGENPFRNQTRDAIAQALRDAKAKRVFEFGGGIGTDAMWFSQAGFQWTYYDLPAGQTFKFATWRFAQGKLPVTVVTHPTQSIDNDAVISVEVFEHLPNLLAALRTINRALRVGGLLIFTESFGKTDRHPLHLARTAVQGRFLNELVQAAGFEPFQLFGPEDCLYRAIKRRNVSRFDYLRALGMIGSRVIRKIPSKLRRTILGRKPAIQSPRSQKV